MAVGRPLVHLWAAPRCAYAARDSTGVPTREAKRRGAGGLPGVAGIGWSHRLGGYAGCPLLLAVHPVGGVTGLGCGSASAQAPPRADTFFAWRRWPPPRGPSVGTPALGPSVVAKGFAGQANHAMGGPPSGAQVLCPPTRQSTTPWPTALRRWLAGVRQSVETVYDKLCQTCRLDRARPHALSGFHARVAAKIALHNVCIWLNEQLGRPRLAFTDLVDW